MAKQLIPEELQALIDQYLTDGVLTDKERQVILRKAEGMGLDRDEIDLYLDAEVQKIDQATDAAARRQKGKTCPYCGGSIPQLTDKCPHCGENITPEASSELQEIFDNLEEALVNLKSGKDIHASKATVERFARKAKMYFGNNPKVQKLLAEIETETVNAEKKAKALVRNRGIINFVKEKPKTVGCLSIILICIILGIVGSIWEAAVPSFTYNIELCKDSINYFLANDDPQSAASIFKQYEGDEKFDDSITKEIVKSFIARKEIDQAADFCKNRHFRQSRVTEDVILSIEKAYIDNGEYDKAIGVSVGESDDHIFRTICLCIDNMKHKETIETIKSFIDINSSHFDRDSQESYKNKLYDYAGIDYVKAENKTEVQEETDNEEIEN